MHKATGLPKATVVRLMKTLCVEGYASNDRRQGGYAVASRVKSLSNGFHGDPLVVEAAPLSAIRKQGFAERDPMVEPRSSGTIAVPIVAERKVLATVGVTYFTSALKRPELAQIYVPLVQGLAHKIAGSVAALR
ncbi:MAG: hypothetical protein NVSMB26_07810 [Beijerinckiaceae bacterium]